MSPSNCRDRDPSRELVAGTKQLTSSAVSFIHTHRLRAAIRRSAAFTSAQASSLLGQLRQLTAAPLWDVPRTAGGGSLPSGREDRAARRRPESRTLLRPAERRRARATRGRRIHMHAARPPHGPRLGNRWPIAL